MKHNLLRQRVTTSSSSNPHQHHDDSNYNNNNNSYCSNASKSSPTPESLYTLEIPSPRTIISTIITELTRNLKKYLLFSLILFILVIFTLLIIFTFILDLGVCGFEALPLDELNLTSEYQPAMHRGLGVRFQWQYGTSLPGSHTLGHPNNNCNTYLISICSVLVSKVLGGFLGHRNQELSDDVRRGRRSFDVGIKTAVSPPGEDASISRQTSTEHSAQLRHFYTHNEQSVYDPNWHQIFQWKPSLLPSNTLGSDYIRSDDHSGVTHQKFTLYMNTYDRIGLLRQHLRYYAQFHETMIDRILVSWGDVKTEIPDWIHHLVNELNQQVSMEARDGMDSDSEERIPFITIIKEKTNSLNNRYNPHDDLIRTDAVFCVDDDIIVHPDDLKFAFEAWKWYPDQHVGYTKFGRSHTRGYKTYAECRPGDLKNQPEDDLYYYGARCKEKTSKSGSDFVWRYYTGDDHRFSMVLNSACFFHRKYLELYQTEMSPKALQIVDDTINCEDLTLSFLIAHVSRKPPILVETKYHIYHMEAKNKAGHHKGINLRNDHYQVRSKCMNDLVSIYGYMPLLYSNYKLSPVEMSDLNSRSSRYRKDGRVRVEYYDVSQSDE